MIRKRILDRQRVRRIRGGFGFIPHSFVTDGYLNVLDGNELLLYFFLILVADQYGLSFYNDHSICNLAHMSFDNYIHAREGLIKKDLIAYDGTLFQVLDLPDPACGSPKILTQHLLKEV